MKSDPNNPKSISARARARRVQQFVHYAERSGISNAHVLDIGGTNDYWKMNLQYVPDGLIESIDIVNLLPGNVVTETIRGIVLNG